MSVYDTLHANLDCWLTAFAIFAIITCIGVILSSVLTCASCNSGSRAVFVLSILSISITVVSVIGLGVTGIASGHIDNQVKRTKFYSTEYDITQMAIDYDARELEDNNAKDDYIIHYEGYGSEEWILFTSPKHEQNQYRLGTV